MRQESELLSVLSALPWNLFSRKEVFQPHLPVRLPCYDLAPVTGITFVRSLRLHASGTPGFHGLTGGVYKARERIHRAMADARFQSELRQVFGIRASLLTGCLLYLPL